MTEKTKVGLWSLAIMLASLVVIYFSVAQIISDIANMTR